MTATADLSHSKRKRIGGYALSHAVTLLGGVLLGIVTVRIGRPRAMTKSSRPTTSSSGRTRPELTLEDLGAFIDERLTDKRLDVGLIMSTFGISRTSLYRLFKAHGGVARYLLEMRLEAVYAELTDNDGPLLIRELARRWCFSDGSHLTRAFRARFGVNPSAMRKGVSRRRTTSSAWKRRKIEP